VTTASLALVAETALAVKKRLDGLNMEVEGCPPLPQAIARGLLTDLPSYKITAHPEYKHLFPKGDDVTEPL
jgi:Ni,Fe-hydrogenase III small subunit